MAMSNAEAGALNASLSGEADNDAQIAVQSKCVDRTNCHGTLNNRGHCVPCRHFHKRRCDELAATIKACRDRQGELDVAATQTFTEFTDLRTTRAFSTVSHEVWAEWVKKLEAVAQQYRTQIVESAGASSSSSAAAAPTTGSKRKDVGLMN